MTSSKPEFLISLKSLQANRKKVWVKKIKLKSPDRGRGKLGNEMTIIIFKKLIKSFCVLLPDPSAMLDGIEIEHLWIWDIRPNFSSLGISLQMI